MWFTKSFITISAAVILAMDSDNYMAACLFFALGATQRSTERMAERRQQEHRAVEEEEEED